MEENGNDFEDEGLEEDDHDESENDDEIDAIIREKDENLLPRNNV